MRRYHAESRFRSCHEVLVKYSNGAGSGTASQHEAPVTGRSCALKPTHIDWSESSRTTDRGRAPAALEVCALHCMVNRSHLLRAKQFHGID